MPALDKIMKTSLRQGASLSASTLETAAGALRRLAGQEESRASQSQEPAGAAASGGGADDGGAGASATAATRPTGGGARRPSSGTRSRIANPKAARKARARKD